VPDGSFVEPMHTTPTSSQRNGRAPRARIAARFLEGIVAGRIVSWYGRDNSSRSAEQYRRTRLQRQRTRMLPGGEVPAKPSHDLDAGLDQLPEGGFGWGLIREMTTMLLYKRSEEQNILRFGVILENV